jgi:UDP-N-acetyl-D-mannosaminuronate dehydrogenase
MNVENINNNNDMNNFKVIKVAVAGTGYVGLSIAMLL